MIKNTSNIRGFEIQDNPSKKYITGSVWKSRTCDNFKIIGKSAKQSNCRDGATRCRHYVIEFIDYPHVMLAQYGDINTGLITNPMYPLLYGKGCRGLSDIDTSSKVYSVWSGILRRCYCDKFKKQTPCYKDATVDSRWHNLSVFAEDIKKLGNYDKWLKGTASKFNEYHIDKDTLIAGNKHYSIETCTFLHVSVNVKIAGQKGGIAISPTGEEFVYTCQADFAESQGWDRDNGSDGISACLSQKKINKTYKGWTFKLKD